MQFTNMLFDLGGVIVPLNFENMYSAFESLGVEDPKAIIQKVQDSGEWDQFETGELSETEFLNTVNQHLDIELSQFEFDHAFNSMLEPISDQTIELLLELKNHFSTALLSNTNPIHIAHINDELVQKGIDSGLDGLFNTAHLSYELGFRKPSAEAYQIVLADMNWTPEDTIFFDDTVDNLAGAEIVGLTGELIAPGNGLHDLFEVE